jgi:hypothetical protein
MSTHENPFPPYDHDLNGRDTRMAAGADTPPGAEARMEAYRDALDEAVKALTAARNAELDAQEARDEAKTAAQLSEDCPPVGVFEGKRTTVAYQKAWIANQIADLEHAYKVARETRRAAAGHLDKLSKQGRFQQTITASVREAYRGTSGRNW